MRKNRLIREITGWRQHSHNMFLSSTALVNEDWSVNGDWAFAGNVSSTNPISAADPVDADDLVTLGYFETHAGLYQGVLDASAGIPYPAATEGMYWRISVAGTIGTTLVEVGDQVIAIADYAGGMDDTKFMIVQTTTQITDVTYSQLQTLITNATLETGRQYRITDYATAYNVFDGGTNTVIEAQLGTAEPLIVLAIGEATLAKEAYSELYPQDIIYYNPLVNAVERAAFIAAGDIGYVTAGSLVAGFKGLIEFRHDTKQNVSTWYDFRNIKFRRWAVDAVAYDGGTAYVAKDVCKSGVDGKIYKCITATTGEGDPTVNTADWILWWDIVANAYVSWTSDKTKFNIGDITPTNLVFVPATYQDVYTFGDWYQHVNNVTIGKNDLALVMDYGYNSTLNNIVFKTQDDIYTCYSNEIGEMSYNNTIGTYFSINTIGTNFNSNTIGDGFGINTICNYFSINTIGNDFRYNTISNSFSYNTISNSFNYNTIGTKFYFNTIGDGFGINTIGNEFYSNTIGNYFISNTIDYKFYSNTIGNDFISNTIGNNFYSNTIGTNFRYNTISNSFSYNTIGNSFFSNTIGTKFNSNTIGNDFKTNTIGNDFNHNTIGNNFNYNTIGNYFYYNTIGTGFISNTIGNRSRVSAGINCQGNSIGDFNTQVTLGDNCIGISIGENNGPITLGAGCQYLTFKNGCIFTNTNATALKNTTFENAVVNGLDFAAATHIKAAYSKTVFMNATSIARLSYFDALNALTVVDVNA